jgi:hypothetical protein
MDSVWIEILWKLLVSIETITWKGTQESRIWLYEVARRKSSTIYRFLPISSVQHPRHPGLFLISLDLFGGSYARMDSWWSLGSSIRGLDSVSVPDKPRCCISSKMCCSTFSRPQKRAKKSVWMSCLLSHSFLVASLCLLAWFFWPIPSKSM